MHGCMYDVCSHRSYTLYVHSFDDSLDCAITIFANVPSILSYFAQSLLQISHSLSPDLLQNLNFALWFDYPNQLISEISHPISASKSTNFGGHYSIWRARFERISTKLSTIWPLPKENRPNLRTFSKLEGLLFLSLIDDVFGVSSNMDEIGVYGIWWHPNFFAILVCLLVYYPKLYVWANLNESVFLCFLIAYFKRFA